MSIFTYGPQHADYADIGKPRWENVTPTRGGLELRLTLESLGLSAREYAEYMGVSLRSVQYWEASQDIPGHAESAIRELEHETGTWLERISGKQNIITHRYGVRQIGKSWIAESWWRALVGKAITESGATAVMEQKGYAPSPIWQDDEYLRFEIACPGGVEQFRTGKDGEGLYMWKESGTISLPEREPIMEWKEILGSMQFRLSEDERENRHHINKLITDLEVRDVSRTEGINPGVGAAQIGGRYIGQ